MSIEIFVLIDADGSCWASHDADLLDEDGEAVNPTRTMTITLEVPLPVSIELAAVIPPECLPNVPVTMTVK